MILATWNVERLKHIRKLDEIIKACVDIHADILVLTETDERIKLPYKHCWFTEALDQETIPYKSTERRVAIYTNYDCVDFHNTYDGKTSICVEVETEKENLLIYGTIMGVLGNRDGSYLPDLIQQVEDFRRLSEIGSLCIAGDYNCSFADNYYFTAEGRAALMNCFSECSLKLVTGEQKECIDHIAVSAEMVGSVTVSEWNVGKELSDHKGIAVRI